MDFAISYVPGRIGHVLRQAHYSRKLKNLGRGSEISVGVQIMDGERISIGNGFSAGRNCWLAASGGGIIEIGNNVSIASNVTLDAGENGIIRIGDNSGVAHNCVLRTSPHNYSDPNRPFKSQGHKPGSIIIEEDVWIAVNSTLSPGTHIERGCIVGSGSVVGGRIKPFSIIAGNPARVIGKRG